MIFICRKISSKERLVVEKDRDRYSILEYRRQIKDSDGQLIIEMEETPPEQGMTTQIKPTDQSCFFFLHL